MAKKKDKFQNVIDQLETEIIKDNGAPIIFSENPTEDELQERKADSLLDNIPSDQGYYFKIYRIHPIPEEYQGQPMYLHQITRPDLINDMESEVLKLAQKYGWISGIYEARKYRAGVSGDLGKMRIPLEVPKEIIPDATPIKPQDPMDAMRNAMGIIREMNNAVGQKETAPQMDIGEVMKVVAEMYKANTPQPVAADPMKNMIMMLAALKEIAPPPAPESPDLLAILEKVGAFHKPETKKELDIFELMNKMKMLMPAPAAIADPMDGMLDKMTKMMTVMNAMGMGGGGDSNVSTAVEMIRILGPQLKDVVSDVTSTINNVVRTKRRAPKSRTGPTKVETEQKDNIPSKNTIPALQKVEAAAKINDKAFFPELEELLRNITTPSQFDELVDGKIPQSEILTQISMIGGPFFLTKDADLYFKEYLIWAKNNKSLEIPMTCDKCEIEIIYDSIEEYESDKICPECQGNMIEPGSKVETSKEDVIPMGSSEPMIDNEETTTEDSTTPSTEE